MYQEIFTEGLSTVGTYLGLGIDYVPDYMWRMLVASILGFLLGFERALRRKQASFTTFSLISLGSCILTYLSISISADLNAQAGLQIADPTRIPSYIISGIGFASAGIIIFDKKRNNIEGLTTAVMMWLAMAIGMCCGFGKFQLALWNVVLYFIILKLARISHRILDSYTEEIKE